LKPMQFLDLKQQYLLNKDRIDRRIHQVLEHGNFIMGPEVSELENELAAYVGVRHCVTCASGTDALLMAVLALGVKAGDEVIVPDFSFFATAEILLLLGIKPVYVDVSEIDFNIDPHLIRNYITDKTKAIIAVSLYGQCADFNQLNALAAEYGLAVIEDGAQSFGAIRNGKKSGALCSIGCTSFFPSKPLGCYGDGGACFTDDDAIAENLKSIRVHGQTKRYVHDNVGINGRLDTIQAAILLEKLPLLDGEIEQRNRIARTYSAELGGLDRLIAPSIVANSIHAFGQYTLRVGSHLREPLLAYLSEREIPTAIHYPATLSSQKANQKAGVTVSANNVVAEQMAREVFSIPVHPYLEPDEQHTVIEAIRTFLEKTE